MFHKDLENLCVRWPVVGRSGQGAFYIRAGIQARLLVGGTAVKKTTMMIGAAALAFAGAAQAGMLLEEMHMNQIDLNNTDWMETVNVTQFDDQGGNRILTQVMITLDGHVEGQADAESMDAAPATVTVNLGATITLSLMGDDLAVALPIAMDSFEADIFDGNLDFDGPSGMSFPGLMSDDSDMATLTSGMDDLMPWIGGGTVALDATAMGASSGTGSGNLFLMFETLASAKITVIYKYTEIPTPGAFALLGMAGACATRRRR